MVEWARTPPRPEVTWNTQPLTPIIWDLLNSRLIKQRSYSPERSSRECGWPSAAFERGAYRCRRRRRSAAMRWRRSWRWRGEAWRRPGPTVLVFWGWSLRSRMRGGAGIPKPRVEWKIKIMNISFFTEWPTKTFWVVPRRLFWNSIHGNPGFSPQFNEPGLTFRMIGNLDTIFDLSGTAPK